MKKLGLWFLILCSPIVYGSEKTEKDYEEAFSGTSLYVKEKNAKSLAWAGFSEASFFDLIESDVLATYKERGAKSDINSHAWLIKALGFSGNVKYLPTLEIVAKEAERDKLRRYAKLAIRTLPSYTIKNKIIYPDNTQAYPSREQRLLNILNSSDLELITAAAKRIYDGRIFDERVMSALVEGVESRYKATSSKQEVFATAYMLKALARSSQEKYKPLLKKVHKEASSLKLRGYARKYIADFYSARGN